MNNFSLHHKKSALLPAFALLLLALSFPERTFAQTFSIGALPAGKTIIVTYKVDVNANVCPAGTMPTDITNQSNVTGTNIGGTVQTDDPDTGASGDATLTPVATLSLGNLVYKDNNSNGVFDAGDVGVNGVSVRLFADNGDGVLTGADGAAIANATTAGGGLYAFANLCPGDYIVEVAASNFNIGGPLYDNALMASLISSPVGGAADPDNDVNNDDNGDPVSGFGVASKAITLALNAEPITDGDADPNTNLSLDFGFKLPTIITINDVTMNEGTGGSTTSFNFTVTRSIPDEAFSLTVNTADGTATVGDNDYAAINNGTVSFTAGGPLTQTVTVLVNHDSKVENNETFTVNLSGAPAGVAISDGTGQGTITNDDAATVTLTAPVSQLEGNAGTTTYIFTATLNNPVQGGFTVPYTINPGTATTADLDYSGSNGSLSFVGTAGETKTITVTINGDVKVELDETFTVALGAISGAPAGVTTAGSPATGTITNDDAAVVAISGNVSQAENLTPQVFTVTLSNPVDAAVTVLFNTSDGTATIADNDYTGVTNQTVTFAPNITTPQTVNVTITNDNKVEANEVYNVAIGTLNASGRNVSLGTSTGTGTITNDDAATVTLSGGGAAAEGNSGTTTRTFTLTLNNPVQGGFQITADLEPVTASFGSDISGPDVGFTFTGTAGETKTTTVTIFGDLTIEPDETFTVTLINLTGAPAGVTIAGSPQTGTILNDEQDWGDAPSAAQSGFAGTYPTLSANNGARHGEAPGGLHLGPTVDAENDGQPTATADGDDGDEDGVTLPGVLVTNNMASITVNSSGTGKLDAWVDFNRDGDWADAGEQVFTSTNVVSGNNPLTFSVPAGASLGTSFARFRLSTAGALAVTGAATDGEVEDYQVSIVSNQYAVSSPSVAEGNAGTTNLIYTISRTTNTTAGSVDYAITGGSATSGSDYSPLAAGTINFTAGGAMSQDITVSVNGDLVVEDNETVIITLSNPVNGGLGANPGTGTITNDDNATLTLSGGSSQNEGSAGNVTYTFTATLSAAVQGGFQIAYTTNNGTATAGSDYTDNDGTLTFTGTAGETKTITVQAPGDITVELDETFTENLGAISATSAVQAAAITKAGSPQTATILNDDVASVALAGNVSQAENLTPQVFTVTLSNPVDVPVTVLFNTSDGTATVADNDYTGISNQTVTFAANTTTSQTVNVTIVNDSKVEANEVYNVALGTLNATGRNVSLGTSTGTGTIVNDDAATVTLSGGGAANEGNSGTTPRVFTATLNNPVQGGFTLPYTTNDGTATTADNDYVDNDGPALVFSGTAGEAKTITVLVNGDSKVEANETFTVALGAIAGAPAGLTTAGSPQTGTINNDEVDWGDGPDTLPTRLIMNGARHNTVLGFQLGAAIDGDPDGQPGASATGDDNDADGDDEDGVTLPAVFVTGTTATITVNASQAGKLDAFMDFNWNRNLGDAGEKIFNNVALVPGNNVLSFAVPAGATVGVSYLRFRFSSAGGLSNTGLAADGEVEDYMTSIVSNQFSINSPSVAEGNAGTTSLTFTVTRTTNAAASSVDYAITGGSANSGSDYQPLAAGTLNFPAGGALSLPVTVTVNGDLVVEDNETVIVTLSNAVNGGIGTNPGTGTITNDDNSTLTISGGSSLNETNAGTVSHTFTVVNSAAVQGGFTVAYTTNDGTAIAPGDYTDNDGTLTFTGTAGESKTITVLANGDVTVELNETFTENLGAIGATTAVQAAAIIKSGSPQTATILNDDAATVALAGNVSQAENLTPQVFTVTLSNPVDVPVTVLFNTSDGTATIADNDYAAVTNQTVTFAANTTTSQTVNVTIVNDNKVENNEVYNVALGTLNATGRNVSLGTSSGTGTIVNDDAATITLTPAGGITQNEGNTGTTLYQFFATLNNPVQGSFTVNYTTNDGSATAGSDYIDNDGIVSFSGAAGQSQPISVLVNGDFFVEPDETFTVALGAITGAPAGVTTAGSPQTGTILNDEVDYGDAPDPTYPTLLASNGARHNATVALRLGAAIDGDPNGQPNATGTGDDTDAEGDDEDGVTLPNPLVTSTNATVTVNASATGKLDGWVDFNNNGSWADAGEKIFNNVALVAGNNSLSFSVPAGATPSTTFARFRLSSVGGLSFNGAAADGEVEDYQVQIVNTQFSINDPTVTEGNAGTTNLAFVISRSTNANACSVNYAITGGTATTADNDYQALAAGTASFTAGGALTQTINVVVNGDTKVELNETVDMTLSNPVNGSILDGSGTGTIVNDDAAVITITNPTVTEGDVATTVTATFTINMSTTSDANVVVNYATVDNTATVANNDYLSTSGSHTFTPGQTSKTVSVTVNGDCAIEANEAFFLRLSGLVNNGRNVTLSGGGATLDGTGTINNDDALPVITCPANLTVNAAQGVCNATVTLALPTLSSICGSSTLEFRYRTVDNANNPTGAFTAYAPAASNTVNFLVSRYEIEWRITDGSGASSCSFYLLVQDIQPPLISCPPNMNIPANGSCSGTVGAWSPASLSDNCTATGSIVVVQTPPASTVLSGHNDSRVVTLTATDQYGNSASCAFTITLKDVTPPVAACKNATINLGTNGTVTVLPSSVNNGSSDNCTFNLTLTPNTFTCANVGNNTVTLKATDAGGNTATCTAVVIIKDVNGPTALCKTINVFLNNTGHATITAADVDNGSFDPCGIATRTINNNEFDCGQIGGTPVYVLLTLKDNNNNTSTCTATVYVKDAIPPEAVCSNTTVTLGSNGKVTVMVAPLTSNSTDNCSVWSVYPIAKQYTTANIGVNNLSITVKDYSNNGDVCVSQITVLPYSSNQPPSNSFQVPNQQGPNVLLSNSLDFSVFPNPTEGNVTLLFDLEQAQPYTLRLFDVSGREVYGEKRWGEEGENALYLNLGELPAGWYLIDIENGALHGRQKLVIQR